MNWLGRLVFGAKADEMMEAAKAYHEKREELVRARADEMMAMNRAPAHADDLIHCPSCRVSCDFTRCFSIVGARVSGERIESVERGATFSCQRCGHVFTLTPSGPLERHPQALPHMAQRPAAAPPPEPGEPTRKPGKVRADDLVPKERPRV